MTDQVSPEGGALPSDVNASPEAESTDVVTQRGSEADSSPAADPGEKRIEVDPRDERIKELTRHRREAERRADRLQSELLQRLNQQQQPPQQPRPQAEKAKTLSDFNFDAAAFTQYSIQQATVEATKAAEAKAAQAREEETARARREVWEERFDKFAEEHPEILDGWDETPITQAMGAALEGSENGPEVGAFLAKNKAVAKQLSKMHPFDAAREIGRIEERLAIERKKASEKSVSQAPPPTPRVDAKTASERISTTSPESDKLSDEEWVRAEQARLNRKAKRQAN